VLAGAIGADCTGATGADAGAGFSFVSVRLSGSGARLRLQPESEAKDDSPTERKKLLAANESRMATSRV
jgi:hypothetical protein